MITTDSFTYFISERKSIVVLSFVGTLDAPNAQEELGRCLEDLVARLPTTKVIIFNCRDLGPKIVNPAVLLLTRMQVDARAVGITLRISSLHPELKTYLCDRGVVRKDELSNNLTECFQSLGIKLAA